MKKTYTPAKEGEVECERCGSADLIQHSGDIEDSDESVYWYECNNCGYSFN